MKEFYVTSTGWAIKKGAFAFSSPNREFFSVYAHFFHTMLIKTCFKSGANFKEKYQLMRKLELIEVGSAKNAVNSWGRNMIIKLLCALRREGESGRF